MNFLTCLFMSLMLLDCRILLAGDFDARVLNDYDRGQFLKVHNSVRASEGLSPVKWDKYLAGQAQSWANHLARTCKAYSSGNQFGENISIEWGVFPTSPYLVVKKWIYKGRSEVLWQSSLRVGCGKSFCIDSATGGHANIFVCHYFPRERLDDETIYIRNLNF